jgi:DNA invertase Pin-like site-specific DNA recombinase
MTTKYVVYLRVSTARQGRSGLGLEAQRAAVEAFMSANGPRIELASYTEIESGKHNDRPQLAKALLHCRRHRATLLVAKIDRLSRNAAFLMNLRDAGVKFVAADLPDLNTLTLGIFASMAQYEREQISTRTKAALAAAKARGVKLGNPDPHFGSRRSATVASRGNIQAADEYAGTLRHSLTDAKAAGFISLRAVAGFLNDAGIGTRRGCAWTPAAVLRVLKRAGRSA